LRRRRRRRRRMRMMMRRRLFCTCLRGRLCIAVAYLQFCDGFLQFCDRFCLLLAAGSLDVALDFWETNSRKLQKISLTGEVRKPKRFQKAQPDIQGLRSPRTSDHTCILLLI
jgi:hypothetical protein